MTREEEIKKQAEKKALEPSRLMHPYAKQYKVMSAYEIGFIEGAVWADAHPDIDVRTMAAWQSGYNEGIAKSRWISVEDELPPLNQDVLVCSVINQDNAVAIDRIIQNIEDNGYADWELYTDITHWMPLPSIEHLRETTKMIEKGGEE